MSHSIFMTMMRWRACADQTSPHHNFIRNSHHIIYQFVFVFCEDKIDTVSTIHQLPTLSPRSALNTLKTRHSNNFIRWRHKIWKIINHQKYNNKLYINNWVRGVSVILLENWDVRCMLEWRPSTERQFNIYFPSALAASDFLILLFITISLFSINHSQITVGSLFSFKFDTISSIIVT